MTARAALPLVPGAPWAVGTVGAAGRVCAGGRGQRGCTALYAFLILLFVVLQSTVQTGVVVTCNSREHVEVKALLVGTL